MLSILQCRQHPPHIISLNIVRLEWKMHLDAIYFDGGGWRRDVLVFDVAAAVTAAVIAVARR